MMAKKAKQSPKPKASAKGKAAPKAKEVSKEHVAVAAYFKWQKRGHAHGNDQHDWFEAEKDLGKR